MTSGVQCAILLQKEFLKEELPVRIGMHLGEVVFTEYNAFGDGVNIASRIESMGIPGSVLVSDVIRNQIKKLGIGVSGLVRIQECDRANGGVRT